MGAIPGRAMWRAAVLCAAWVPAMACAAEWWVTNVNGYTLNADGRLQRFDAMLIDQGKVVATGTIDALAARAGQARTIDGEGRTLLPGMTDAHGHVLGLGFAKLRIDLAGTASLDEALQRVRDGAAKRPGSGWLTGRGWNQVVWKLQRFPTAAELDRAVADRPVWLTRVDGHAGWANSAALKLAGIGRDTVDPPGGRIERDAQGHATGVLIDAAMGLVQSKIPPPDARESEAALAAALAELAGVGITSVHDAGVHADTVALYRRTADAGKLTARLYAMIGGVGQDFDQLAGQGPLLGYGADRLTVRSVKLFADGALGSRGAALIEPYSDAPEHRGLLFHDRAAMRAQVLKAVSKGFQVNVHAIGDAGNRVVLDAFADARAKFPKAELRHRIEHAQVVALADIPRFKSLGLIASMQPTHATSDMNMAEDRVGRERIRGAYAWRRFLKQGTRIAAGSDFPVEASNPFLGWHAAVTRQSESGEPPGGWYPGEAMSRVETFRAFTLDAAFAAHQEKRQGSLEPGKWADFILLDRDPFTIPARELHAVRVLETWVAGTRVFQRPGFAGPPVIVVRHAERGEDAAAPKDPPLSAVGTQRAERLAALLRDTPLSAVYVTPYRRTRDTGGAVARSKGLQVTEVNAADTAALAARIAAQPPGRAVLVVGHSNTVPDILKALGAERAVAVADDEYDGLWRLTPTRGGALLETLRY
ncbi:MAG: amidohydrolase family protein [Betaproteobacteria bacterium]|nr:amidohydrolase family protein [Betaproteobacteria bacterium]